VSCKSVVEMSSRASASSFTMTCNPRFLIREFQCGEAHDRASG
jgi:hypothetical protein